MLKRRRTILALSCALAVAIAAGLLASWWRAKEPRPGELPTVSVVHTWDDLRRQPPLDLGGGVTIRLGLEADAGSVGSGVLLYAFTDGYNDQIRWQINRDRLGPCWVSAAVDGQSLDASKTYEYIPRWEGMGDNRPKLFARPVMLDRAKEFRLTIRTEDGRELARVTVRGTDEPFHPWSPLLLLADAEYERVDRPWPDKYRRIAPARAVNLGAGVCLPVRCGYAGFPCNDNSPWSPPDPPNPDLLLSVGPLPRLLPEAPDPDLRVTVEPGPVLRVTLAGGGLRTYRPDWHFLARWWVNGRPVITPPAHPIPKAGGDALAVPASDVAVRLEVDAAALGARPGDEVGVQLLYCPNGWVPVRNPQANETGWWKDARMTEQVTFRLPE